MTEDGFTFDGAGSYPAETRLAQTLGDEARLAARDERGRIVSYLRLEAGLWHTPKTMVDAGQIGRSEVARTVLNGAADRIERGEHLRQIGEMK